MEEIRQIMDGLYTYRLPDAAKGLRALADAIDQDEHDIDRIGSEVQRIFTNVKSKGEFTQEEIERLRELAGDEDDFHEHLETTKFLLNKGEVNQAFEIIDNFEEIGSALESLENLTAKLDQLEES